MILVRYCHVNHFVLVEARIECKLLKYDLTVVHFGFGCADFFLMGVYSYRFSKVKIVSSVLKKGAPACMSIFNVV